MEPTPDYVKHIRHTHAGKQPFAWCGARPALGDWAFTDIDHAACNADQGGRLLACPACVEAVTAFRRPAS